MESRYAPTSSDTTVLMSVEELIGLALGPNDVNTVNFKIMESVLMVLARQMRILETRVEVKFGGEQTEVSTQIRRESAEAWAESKRRALTVLSRGPRRGTETVYAVQTTSKVGQKPRSRSTRPCRDTSDDEYDGGRGVCDSESCFRRNLEVITARARSGGGSGAEAVRDRSSSRTRSRDGKKGKKRHRTPDGKKGSTQPAAITISEKEMEKSKIQTTENSQVRRVGSIEVVTRSEFALLEQAVRELRERGSPPAPSLPDNARLREELAGGRASLPDAMQAMQVNARIQATEEMIARLAGIMTQLAASGAISGDLTEQFAKLTSGTEGETAGGVREAKRGDDKAPPEGQGPGAGASLVQGGKATKGLGSAKGEMGQRASLRSAVSDTNDFVTHQEMDGELGELREELLRSLQARAGLACSTADKAADMAHRVGDKMDIALKLDGRVSALHSMVEDYAEQLNGFDSGLATQMQGFQEQMSQMRSDLADGLKLLEASNTNAETLAVQELRERCEGAAAELDGIVHGHGALRGFQCQLAEELQSLLAAVEQLREQKAEREEVLDRLRDKADAARLRGLLTGQAFERAKRQLHERLGLAYVKFNQQEEVWLGALKDLSGECQSKAEVSQLVSLREDAQEQLRELHRQLQQLARAAGEPEAAMLTRQLAKDAFCGVCRAPALMPFKDATYGKPPRLPAFRPPAAGADAEECLRKVQPAPTVDERTHMCHRWAGGSHTLVHAPARAQAGPLDVALPPLRRYQGQGADGRYYMLVEELQPCLECRGLGRPECACVPGRPECACVPGRPECACVPGRPECACVPGRPECACVPGRPECACVPGRAACACAGPPPPPPGLRPAGGGDAEGPTL